MNRQASAFLLAALLAACSQPSERAAQEISASEREAEEAATVYQTASETFTAPAENGSGPQSDLTASQENTSQ